MNQENNRFIPDENFRRAWDFVERTGVNVFLTGKAGTGKTTFLRQVMKNSAKTAVVVAPTGVAAINAGGVTIHSFFQLSPAPFVPGAETRDKFNFSKQKLRVIRSLDLLVIDEISMVRSDLLDAVDNALRKYRRDGRPFGGVQLLMIGDLQQLAPVVTPADEVLLRPHYSTPYFFGSHALAETPYVTIRLEKVFRQQNERFVGLLNHVRDNALEEADRRLLNSRLDPAFVPDDGEGYIRLTTHNNSADAYNDERLDRLAAYPLTYRAKISGTFPPLSYPTAETLVLKPGAQVMFVKNDPAGHEYYNGLIGQVISADSSVVRVKIPGRAQPVTVEPQTWENARYKINESTNTVETEIQGTFTQIPLRLAWAITIHKSQGLTFDKVIIDAGASFAPGQVYVALSRCRSLEGLVLATPIQEESLRPDTEVAAYISTQAEAARRSIEALEGIKADYYRQLLVELFTFRDIITREESLSRLVYNTYRHSYPDEARALQRISENLRTDVTAVADKWIAQLRTLPLSTLVSEPFLLRVRKSAVYFYNKFAEIFSDTLTRCQTIKTENKGANKRVAELTLDLRQSLTSRLYLLRDINDNGFTISSYLASKQQAWLKATRDPAEAAREKQRQQRAARKSRSASATPKPEKVPTHEISYRLLRQGLTREDIARERRMTVNTITRHLARYIQSGDLTLDEVLSPVLVNAISSVLQRHGLNAGYPILSASLPGVDFNDIRLVASLSNPDGTLD